MNEKTYTATDFLVRLTEAKSLTNALVIKYLENECQHCTSSTESAEAILIEGAACHTILQQEIDEIKATVNSTARLLGDYVKKTNQRLGISVDDIRA